MARARAREPIFTDIDVVKIAECAVEKHRVFLRDYCADSYNKFDWCDDIDNMWYFSKAEYIVCARELEYRVKVETLLRKLRKVAEQGRYIRYNGRGGSYKLLVRLEEVA